MKNLAYAHDHEKLFASLRTKVMRTVNQKAIHRAEKIMVLKFLLLSVFYLAMFPIMWHFSSQSAFFICCSLLLGFLSLPMVLNIGHEAVHGSLSHTAWINKLGKNVFHLLGTSTYFWQLRHIASHHSYANVSEHDLDISQSSLIRLSAHQLHKPWHRMQYLFMPFAFLFYSLNWFLIRDFSDLTRKQFGTKTIVKHPHKEIVSLVISKLWHLCAFIAIPFFSTTIFHFVYWPFLRFIFQRVLLQPLHLLVLTLVNISKY